MALPFDNGKAPNSNVIREGGYQPTSDPGSVPRSLVRRTGGGILVDGDRIEGPSLSPALARALASPFRVSILRALSERDATAGELVRDLGLSVTQVSHELKALRDWEIIELVGEETRLGSVEHRYRARTDAILPVLEAFAQESSNPG
jgi:DNA-binding transcriptional ArsR family regulator